MDAGRRQVWRGWRSRLANQQAHVHVIYDRPPTLIVQNNGRCQTFSWLNRLKWHSLKHPAACLHAAEVCSLKHVFWSALWSACP